MHTNSNNFRAITNNDRKNGKLHKVYGEWNQHSTIWNDTIYDGLIIYAYVGHALIITYAEILWTGVSCVNITGYKVIFLFYLSARGTVAMCEHFSPSFLQSDTNCTTKLSEIEVNSLKFKGFSFQLQLTIENCDIFKSFTCSFNKFSGLSI